MLRRTVLFPTTNEDSWSLFKKTQVGGDAAGTTENWPALEIPVDSSFVNKSREVDDSAKLVTFSRAISRVVSRQSLVRMSFDVSFRSSALEQGVMSSSNWAVRGQVYVSC